MKNRRDHILIKMLVSLISLFFFLALLEVGLRIYGHIYFSKFDKEIELSEVADDGNRKRILCVGDSFTFGGRVAPDETYPTQLQKLLDGAGPVEKYTVINRGRCESNTRQLLHQLPFWLETLEPDIVILLIGSANNFNAWDYDTYMQENLLFSLRSRFYGLRVVKMCRIIWLNLAARDLKLKMRNIYFHIDQTEDPYHSFLDQWVKKDSGPESDDTLGRMFYFFQKRRIDDALESGESSLNGGPENREEIICALSHILSETGKMREALNLLEDSRPSLPETELVDAFLGHYYKRMAESALGQFRFDKTIELCLKAIKLDPDEYFNYYMMTKAFEFQSSYNSEKIHDELIRMKKDRPSLVMNDLFTGYLRVYKDKQGWDKGVKEWIYHDLNEVFSLCTKNGSRLIIQDYPVDYANANDALKATAENNSLTLIDNTAVFKNLKPREKYLFDDDHCTAEGHKIMAVNIFNELVAEK